MSNKIKHTKIKNTGVLFEVLTRQVTADIIENRDSKSVSLIKKYFNKKTTLGKELDLYNILVNESYKNRDNANRLIDAVVKSRQKLSNSSLRREKYNLIKELRDKYDVGKLFAARIPNYKKLASIYKIFEHGTTEKALRANEYVSVHSYIVESICKRVGKVVKEAPVVAEDKEIRLLAYSLMVEKFNKKYSNLSEKQKMVLKKYINNISNTSNLHEYVSEEVMVIKSQLTKLLPEVTDKITKIKLTEVIKQLDAMTIGKKRISEKALIALMRYYELIEELKNVSSGQSKTLNS
jgi:hypothetical protein